MSTSVLDKIRQERDQARAAALAIAEGDNFNPEDENFKELQARAEILDTRAASMAQLLEQQAAADALDGRLSKAMSAREVKTRAEAEKPESSKSFGELFTRSEAFQDYQNSPRGRMPRIEFDDLETRALPTGLSDLVAAGWTPTPTRVDTTPPQQPTPLLDNITRIQVSNNAVEFVKWEVKAGGAAVVAEKGAKPSIEFGPVVTADSLDNIAVYTQLTRQMLEDEAAVRSIINQGLFRDVRREEEEQAATALAAATLPTSAGSAAAGDDLLSQIRVGIGEVQATGYMPNAILLNPADWAALDNVVMSSTLNGPQVRQNFWGLTPIPSTVQAAGTAIVGDFRTAMIQFFRSQVALYVTDSHADTFLSNVFTLLAERRTLPVVVRPDALIEVSVGV